MSTSISTSWCRQWMRSRNSRFRAASIRRSSGVKRGRSMSRLNPAPINTMPRCSSFCATALWMRPLMTSRARTRKNRRSAGINMDSRWRVRCRSRSCLAGRTSCSSCRIMKDSRAAAQIRRSIRLRRIRGDAETFLPLRLICLIPTRA